MEWITNLYGAINDSIQIEWLSKLFLVLIFLGALLLVPICLSLILPFFKNILKGSIKVYLYAFSTGFFIILATFGFLKESLEVSSLTAAENAMSKTNTYLLNIGLVGGGVLFGLLFAFVLKFLVSYKLNKKLLKSKNLSVFIHEHTGIEGDHHDHHTHKHVHDDFLSSHEDKINLAEDTLLKKAESKLKIVALILLLTHRIPEGLLIGYSLNQQAAIEVNLADSALTTAYFLSLIFHLIPEEMIFYLRLRDAGFSPWKALMISFMGLALFLPFMLIGVYAGDFVNPYLKSFIYASIGAIFLFTSLVEFFPEFYHEIFNKKKWFITLLFLFLGVLFAVIILSFHTHSH